MAADLLFLCQRMPYPPDKGDKIRAHALISRLARTRRVHLACPVDDPADMAHADHMRRLAGGECIFVPSPKSRAIARAAWSALLGRPLSQGYFHHPILARWIGGLLEKRTITQGVAYGSAMAPYLLRQPLLSPARCVLDMVDVDSDKWAQYVPTRRLPARWLYAWEARRLASLERRAALRFGATTLVSSHEAATLAAMVPEAAAKIRGVPNGVDLHYFDPQLRFARPFPEDVQAIVMTGLMDYWPNRQGAEWFAGQVLPLIARKLPRARFYVVGANPPPGFLARMPNVLVTGRVPDVRPFTAHAAVVVAPLQIARGVQNKVLEALAMRRPVVATRAATRALDVAHGRELLIADDAQSFAQAVEWAFHPALGETLGANGGAYVQEHHDWDRALAPFDEILESLNRQALPAARSAQIPSLPAGVPEAP